MSKRFEKNRIRSKSKSKILPLKINVCCVSAQAEY